MTTASSAPWVGNEAMPMLTVVGIVMFYVGYKLREG